MIIREKTSSGYVSPEEVSSREIINESYITKKFVFKNSNGILIKYIPEPNYKIISTNSNIVFNDFCFVDTTSSQITISLPNTSLFLGYKFTIVDYNSTFSSNNCIINNNGIKINSVLDSLILDVNNTKIDFYYVDSNIGFKIV